MTEASIGQLRLVSDNGQLQISSASGMDQPVALNPEEVSELLVFLVSLSATDFNQRQSYRIPLWSGISLKVTLTQGTESVEVSPINLSLTGMLVDLPEDTVAFQTEQGVEAHIELEGKSALVPAKIERIDGPRWGLNLADPTSGNPDPFPDYSEIVMTIQQRWAARFRNA